jgi:serine/threonine-protein kinase
VEASNTTILGGKIQLVRPIASGGQGSVWAARHLGLDAPVAVKLMNAAADPLGRRRFEREAKAAALLRSPHVVQILDHGVHEDTPYIVLELLDGEDLSARLKRTGPMRPLEVAPILRQAAEGLAVAHANGIVHRDLKPANLFLARVPGTAGEVVKILDFGIAKSVDVVGDETRTGSVIGSPHYMSPEQARANKALGPASDLWSLAVIAYRALTGRPPFLGASFGDLICSICTESAPAPSTVAPHLGRSFDPFFQRALARDPAARFGSATELAAAFEAIAQGGPLPAAALPAAPAHEASALRDATTVARPSQSASLPSIPLSMHLTLADAAHTIATGAVAAPRSGRRRAALALAVAGVAIALAAVLLPSRTSHPPPAMRPVAIAAPAAPPTMVSPIGAAVPTSPPLELQAEPRTPTTAASKTSPPPRVAPATRRPAPSAVPAAAPRPGFNSDVGY